MVSIEYEQVFTNLCMNIRILEKKTNKKQSRKEHMLYWKKKMLILIKGFLRLLSSQNIWLITYLFDGCVFQKLACLWLDQLCSSYRLLPYFHETRVFRKIKKKLALISIFMFRYIGWCKVWWLWWSPLNLE